MKPSLIVKPGVIALAFASLLRAQEPPAVVPAPAVTPTPAPATSEAAKPAMPEAAKPAAPESTKPADDKSVKSDKSAKPDKADEENRLRVDFDEGRRMLTASYPNSSQAKLRLYAVNRFDPDIAKPREYFIVELDGAAIVESLKLDADSSESLNAVVSILERFKSEAEKSGALKVDMAKRKASTEAELSREETKLVELQAASSSDATAISASKERIQKLKDTVALSEEIGAMAKISGKMGTAKINMDRPPYDFIASFEPAKELYTMNAGYSFQVAAKHVKFYVELLKKTQDFKKQLLEREAKSKLLKQEVETLFNEKKA